MKRVIFYGSLMSGMSLHGIVAEAILKQEAVFLGIGKFYGSLFLVPNESYPGARPSSSDIIEGEVYAVSTNLLHHLDEVELFYPDNLERSEYVREEIDVLLHEQTIKADVYWWNQYEQFNNALPILSGNFRDVLFH